MNELALTLAEKLEITFDSAVELLPVIQEQFMYHKIISNIIDFIVISSIFIVLGIVTTVALTMVHNTNLEFARKEEEKLTAELKRNKMISITKWLAITAVVLLLAGTGLSIVKVLVSPQYSLLLEVLN